MNTNKFILKAKKNPLDEYEIYYPKTTWDNVVLEDDQILKDYINDTLLTKEEAKNSYIENDYKSNLYIKSEIDEKNTSLEQKINSSKSQTINEIVCNDITVNNTLKSPSMYIYNLFKTSTNESISTINSSLQTLFNNVGTISLLVNGEDKNTKLNIINTTINVGSNISQSTSFSITKTIPSTHLNTQSIILCIPFIKDVNYIVSVNDISATNNTITLNLLKTSSALTNEELPISFLIFGY